MGIFRFLIKKNIHLGTRASLLHVVVQKVISAHGLLLHQVVQEDLHGGVLAAPQEDFGVMGGLGRG